MPSGFPRNGRLRPSTARCRPAVLLTSGVLADRLRPLLLAHTPPPPHTRPAGIPALRRRCAFARRPGSGMYRRARDAVPPHAHGSHNHHHNHHNCADGDDGDDVNDDDDDLDVDDAEEGGGAAIFGPDLPKKDTLAALMSCPLPLLPPVRSLDRADGSCSQFPLPVPMLHVAALTPACSDEGTTPYAPPLQTQPLVSGPRSQPLCEIHINGGDGEWAVTGHQHSQHFTLSLGKRKRLDLPVRRRGRPWTHLASLGRPPLPHPGEHAQD
jgi:hypothetical protein